MAVTDIAGEGGAVVLDMDTSTSSSSLVNMGVVDWSATVEVDQINLPPAFGQKWEGHRSGAGRVRGSISGKLRYAAAETAPWTHGTNTDAFSAFTGTATLTATTGCTIVGTLNFSNVAINRSRVGDTTISADFVNYGNDVTVTWATT